MRPSILHRLVMLAVFVVAPVLSACGPGGTPSTSSFAVNERIGRGVNIIGYDPIWRNRAEGRFQEEHFRLIKEGGFTSVRVNLHPFRHMDDSLTLSDAWFETLDWAVESALAEDLVVILDLHEYNAMAEDPEGRKELFLSFWRQVAPRYRDAPSNVVFELLNEPNRKMTPEMWNGLLREGLAIVRESNPDRTVIIGPGEWNGIGALPTLDLPEDDRNIIVTVHYYTPMEFTHQGARWTPDYAERTGVEWSGSASELQRIRSDFEKVEAWAELHDRPILLGEFGAYDAGPMDSRVRYTAAVARTAEELGWSWAYWQFDSDFIVYDIDENRWVLPIHDALIPPAE